MNEECLKIYFQRLQCKRDIFHECGTFKYTMQFEIFDGMVVHWCVIEDSLFPVVGQWNFGFGSVPERMRVV